MQQSLPFTTDGVGNCGRWRINEGVYNLAVQLPACPVGPDTHPYSFTFVNQAPFAVKLYYLQEGMYRPTHKPMVEPGRHVVDGYVSLAENAMYQVRNEAAEPLGEFQVTKDQEIVYWPPPQQSKQGAEEQAKPPRKERKPLHWPFLLFMTLFAVSLVLWLE